MYSDWCCPRIDIETQGWSYHHGKGLVCTDVERGGFECRPQVLLQCTPILLRSWDGRGIRPVGGSERVGHPHVRFSAWVVVLICSSDGLLALSLLEGVLCGEPERGCPCSILLLL